MKIRFYIFLLAAMLLCGCSLSPVKLPQEKLYTITSVNYHRLAKRPTKYTLLVTTPIAVPAYHDSDMIYSVEPYRLSSFSYHRWIAPPANMLLPLITQSLGNTNYFQAVVSPPFAGVTDFRLDTRILNFKQVFLSDGSRFKMDIEVSLINNNKSRVIATRRINAIIRTSKPSPRSGVVAANQAVGKVLNQLAEFCVRNAR